MPANENLHKVGRESKGTAYGVFAYLLERKEPVSIGEIQRELRLPSPDLASHHLKDLVRLGLVKKGQKDEYLVANDVKTGVLEAFVRAGRRRSPRYIFYSTFFTTLFIIWLVFYLNSPLQTVFLLALGLSGMVFFWYETLRVHL